MEEKEIVGGPISDEDEETLVEEIDVDDLADEDDDSGDRW